MKLTPYSIVSLAIIASANANAGAYMFPELGMMSNSTAGAGAQAIAEGAETAFANPAAMTEFDSVAIAFNLQGMASNIEYSDDASSGIFDGGDETTQAGTAMPVASFYAIKPINDQWSVGFSLASAGGSLIDYGQDFKGSLLLQDAQLVTVQVVPSVAYKIDEQFSVGLGLVSEFAILEQTFGGSEKGNIEATGDSFELGYTLSGFYKMNAHHQFGVTYRSEMDHKLDGELSVDNGEVDSSINIIMPSMALVSGYHQVHADTAIMWSLGWTDFSAVDSTPISLQKVNGAIAREWEDTLSVSVGAHYQLTNKWRLESGVYYETSPQDDPKIQYPDVPTGEIWKLGLGASYDLTEQWRMQMYYEYLYGGTPSIDYTLAEGSLAESTLQGDYDIGVHFFGVLMNYQF